MIDVSQPLPPLFGKGSLRTIKARQDIGVMIIGHGPSPDMVRVETSTPSPMLKFGYAKKVGSPWVWIDGKPERFPVSNGNLCIASPSATIQFEYPPTDAFDFLTLVISHDFILEVIEDCDAHPPEDFWRCVTEPGLEPSLIVSTFDSRAGMFVERLKNTRYRGGVQRLYVEGMALELVAASLQTMLRIDDLSKRGFSIDPKDERRMKEARELLDSRF
ncbi:MAG: hypothetical protein ABSF43_13630 [Rectinemataceae bacterium]